MAYELLDGMLGGAQSVMAFGQQQTQNKLARDRYDLDVSRLGEQKRQYDQSFDQTEKKNAEDIRQYNLTHVLNQAQNARNESQNARLEQTSGIERTKENERQIVSANDKLWKTYKTAGLLTADGLSIDRDVLTQRVKDGDPVAEQVILGMATQFGDLPKGSTATELRLLPNGGYAVTVLNADGSDGVITEDGSSEPNSTTVNFEPGQLSRLAAAEFGMNVITNTSVFDAVGTVNQTNKFEADYKRQSILDQIAALREQRDVLNSLPPGGLKRGAKFAVANAESPEAAAEVIAQIKIDSGNAQPATASTAPQDGAPAQTDTQAPAQTDTQAPTATTPWSMDSVDRTTKSGQLIATIEGSVKNPNRRWSNKGPSQTEKLMARKAELQKNIEQPRVNPNPRSAGRNTTSTKQAAELMADKAELAQINAYIDKDKPALFTSPETDSIATATEGKTGDEILKAVDNGEIQISKDEQLKIAQALKDNEIKELKDMLRLNAREQAVARVAILASEKDPTIRTQMSKELSDLFDNAENSPSMSRKDEIDDKATDRTYRLNRAQYLKSVNDSLGTDFEDANEAAATLIETTSKLFFGDNGDEQNFNAETANMLFKGPALNGFMTRMKRVKGNKVLEDQYMMGLNASISLGMAGLAGEQNGGILESVADFFVRGEVTDNNNPIDFDLRRVRANDTKNPTTFYYTDADGNKTDESIEGEDLRGISASVYEIVREQAIANTPTQKG